MTAVRICMNNSSMRSALRGLFSKHADDIKIVDYRENKDNFSTNLWLECMEDDIEWFLNSFKEEYYKIYDEKKELTIKIFKNGSCLIDRHDSL